MMAGMAFPGTLMLDQKGRVTARFFEDYYVERSTVSSILVRAGAGAEKVNATKVSTAHLGLVTYPSDAEVVPGNRFSLVAEITPASGIHVYAPGAVGYRVVNLTIEPKQGIRLLPIRHPASEVYFFKPLNERVPVFQKPFTLVREVVLEGSREAQAALRGMESVTLNGTLEYQACDDRKCYNPVSLPITWKISLRRLVSERPQPPR
jgi:DsbC/DsbD-like thiol-disulfide interchange protein